MLNIKNQNIHAKQIEIAGVTYPAILSMKAIHEIEEILQEPFETVLKGLYEYTPSNNNSGYIAFNPKYLSTILLSCLKAGGEDVDIDSLIASIRQSNGLDIGLQLLELLENHLPVNTAEYIKKVVTTKSDDSGLDWRSMLYFATAHLNWTQEQFWDSTFFMYGAMLEQHLIYNGVKKVNQERKVAGTYEEWLENVKNG